MIRWLTILAGFAAIGTGPVLAQSDDIRPDQAQFRDIYQELVETDTSPATGSCTLAAEKMLARLRSGGYGPVAAEIFTPEDSPKDGGLVARIEGSDPDAAAMLLVDHIDVVVASADDWGRDPYTLREEDGYFIGRGVIDDKALSAIWIDSLIRMKAEGFRPQRTIKVALTCGEESGTAVNGVLWLIDNRPEAVTAGFALNEGGYGIADEAGNPAALYLAVGEKRSVNFTLEARNRGGHSSRPRTDNAIYALSEALLNIRNEPFPITMTPTSESYLRKMSAIVGGDIGDAMLALADNPDDAAAAEKVSSDVIYNATLRTTCVATVIEGGDAVNALPQLARATVQCRLLPGVSPETVDAHLRAAIGNPDISLEMDAAAHEQAVAVAPPLSPDIVAPAERVAASHFPGTPLVPTLLTAGTDGRFLSAFGVPTYGVPGILLDSDGNGAHGVNERIRVDSVYRGRDYLYDLLKAYANPQPGLPSRSDP